MKRCVIIGASGFGKEMAWIVQRVNAISSAVDLVGFCDDAPEKQVGAFAGYALLGAIESVSVTLDGCFFICAIGNNRLRQNVTSRAIACGLTPLTLVDPTAIVAPDAVVGAGSYIGIGSVVSAGVRIGRGVVINHQTCIGHDACLGDFGQVCPGARISGGCVVGEGAFLGTNATLVPLKKMGEWATLGAGTTAFHDISEGTTIVRLKG